MKKTIILLTFSLSLFISEIKAQEIAVGLKTAIPFFNGSRLTGASANDNTQLTGFFALLNAGLFTHYKVKENWAVQVELLYKDQGFKYSNAETPDQFWEGSYRASYVEIPLLLQYEGTNKFRGFAQVGLSPKFNVKAQRFFQEDGNEEVSTDVKKQFKPFVLAANVGGGFMTDLSENLVLTGELRFSYDITQAASDNKDVFHGIYFENARMFGMAAYVGMSYKF